MCKMNIINQCSKLLPVRLPEADNFGGGTGTFFKIFFNFMFMIWDSRQEDWQLFLTEFWTLNHPTFHETTATNSHSIRTLNSIPEAAILSLLVHMLNCAWWERSVHFCLVPCSEYCVSVIDKWPWTRQQRPACERKQLALHTNYYYFHHR